jgi:hypothetical protein
VPARIESSVQSASALQSLPSFAPFSLAVLLASSATTTLLAIEQGPASSEKIHKKSNSMISLFNFIIQVIVYTQCHFMHDTYRFLQSFFAAGSFTAFDCRRFMALGGGTDSFKIRSRRRFRCICWSRMRWSRGSIGGPFGGSGF